LATKKKSDADQISSAATEKPKSDPKAEPGRVAPGEERVLLGREQRELDALPSRLSEG
jgi:hypothetical protein